MMFKLWATSEWAKELEEEKNTKAFFILDNPATKKILMIVGIGRGLGTITEKRHHISTKNLKAFEVRVVSITHIYSTFCLFIVDEGLTALTWT